LRREFDVSPVGTFRVGEAEVVLRKSSFRFIDIKVSWWDVEVQVAPGIIDRDEILQPLPLLSAHRCVAKGILKMYHEENGGEEAHYDEQEGASRTPWLVISSEA
jgi:hypothetical protein